LHTLLLGFPGEVFSEVFYPCIFLEPDIGSGAHRIDHLKEKSFQTELTKEQERIVKAAGLLGSKSFSCEADAKREAERFLEQFKDAFHHATESVLPRERESGSLRK